MSSVLILVGCGKKPDQDPIIARVGDQGITRSQLLERYGLLVADDSVAATALEKAARDWASHEILVQEAIKRHLDQDTLFLRRLQHLQQELLVRSLYDRFNANLEVDSLEVTQEYTDHHSEYRISSDQVDLAYLIAPSRESAAQARKSLLEGQSLYTVLTADESLTGQSVGWVSQNDLNPAIARIAFTLVPGGLSYPQKRDDGHYLIIMVRQRRLEGSIKPLEEVFPEVRSRLYLSKQAETEKALRDSLWTAYRPQILIGASAAK